MSHICSPTVLNFILCSTCGGNMRECGHLPLGVQPGYFLDPLPAEEEDVD